MLFHLIKEALYIYIYVYMNQEKRRQGKKRRKRHINALISRYPLRCFIINLASCCSAEGPAATVLGHFVLECHLHWIWEFSKQPQRHYNIFVLLPGKAWSKPTLLGRRYWGSAVLGGDNSLTTSWQLLISVERMSACKVCDVFLISCLRNAFWLENKWGIWFSFLPYIYQETVTHVPRSHQVTGLLTTRKRFLLIRLFSPHMNTSKNCDFSEECEPCAILSSWKLCKGC